MQRIFILKLKYLMNIIKSIKKKIKKKKKKKKKSHKFTLLQKKLN